MSTPHESRRIGAVVVRGATAPGLITLAEAMMAIAPAVEIHAPDTVLLDASAAPLLGGEASLAREALAIAARVRGDEGSPLRVAIADGAWAARALARFGGGERAASAAPLERDAPAGWHPRDLAKAVSRNLQASGTPQTGSAGTPQTGSAPSARAYVCIARPGENKSALAPLPLSALELSEGVLERLASLGIDRLGALAELPTRSLAARFGVMGEQAVRLARGVDPTPMTPHVPVVLPEESLDLEGGVEALEPLVFVTKGLAERLAARLEGRVVGATALALTLTQDSREAHTVPITLTTPSSSTALWMPVLKEAIGALRLPAPVVKVTLAATGMAPRVVEQLALDDHPERIVALEAVLSRLESRLGEGTVLRALPADRHRPEGAFTLERFDPQAKPPAGLPARARQAELGRGISASIAPEPAVTPPPSRPARLFAQPERVEVVQREDRWVAVRVGGVTHAVEEVTDHERLVGEWWLPVPFDRSYARVTLRGLGECWIYRVGADDSAGTPYLHGCFD